LCYDRFARIYSEVFGEDKFHIITFESIFKKKQFQKLEDLLSISAPCGFSERKEKASPSYINYKRNMALGTTGIGYFWRYFWSAAENFGIYSRKSIDDVMGLSQAQEKQLKTIFERRNRWLDDKYNLDLERLGYF